MTPAHAHSLRQLKSAQFRQFSSLVTSVFNTFIFFTRYYISSSFEFCDTALHAFLFFLDILQFLCLPLCFLLLSPALCSCESTISLNNPILTSSPCWLMNCRPISFVTQIYISSSLPDISTLISPIQNGNKSNKQNKVTSLDFLHV